MRECEKYAELIHGYIDNGLSAQERKKLENHLAGCANCKKQIEIFSNLKMTLRERTVPEPVPASLRERIAGRELKPSGLNPFVLIRRWGLVFSAVAIIIGVVIFYQQRMKPSHFLVLREGVKIQKHIDGCIMCQKSSVEIIKRHIRIVSVEKSKVRMQKHLDGCPDCEDRIVEQIKECMEAMAWKIQRGLFEDIAKKQLKDKRGNKTRRTPA